MLIDSVGQRDHSSFPRPLTPQANFKPVKFNQTTTATEQNCSLLD